MDYQETNRDRNKQAERKRMPKSGANLASIYRAVIVKRAIQQAKLARN